MSITLILIITTAGISYYAWSNPGILSSMLLNPAAVSQRNEYYRFLTSGFVHADTGHLFFNMLSLYFMGEVVEHQLIYSFGESLGVIYYLVLYIGGIMVSDIPSYLKNRYSTQYNSLGASGGVSAIVFASVLFYPTSNICLYFFICMPSFIFGLLYIAYSYYEARRGLSYINHSAHLWGALFGIAFIVLIFPEVLPLFFDSIAGWKMF